MGILDHSAFFFTFFYHFLILLEFYLKQLRVPRSTFLFITLFKNIFILKHGSVILKLRMK